MIKGLLETNDGLPVFLLGLSDENVKRLTNNQPILVDLAEVSQGGYQGFVLIHHGATERVMAEELVRHFRVDKVVDKTKEPS